MKNHYDLLPNEQMDSVIGLLHSMVSYNYQRLKVLVDGLAQEEIDYHGIGHQSNSIAQQLRHLAVVDLHWVYRLQESNIPVDLYNHYGPMYGEDGRLPQIMNVPLEILLEEYDYVQQLFKNVCQQLTDGDLEKMVPFGKDNEKTATVRWGIWHIADHSRHHYANIAHIRKNFGK